MKNLKKYYGWLEQDLNNYVTEYVLSRIPELDYGTINLMATSRSTVRRVPQYYGTRDRYIKIDHFIAELPDLDRLILQHTYIDRRTQQEIAKEAGLSQGSISKILGQVRDKLVVLLYK